jgi:hypothetical protein
MAMLAQNKKPEFLNLQQRQAREAGFSSDEYGLREEENDAVTLDHQVRAKQARLRPYI